MTTTQAKQIELNEFVIQYCSTHPNMSKDQIEDLMYFYRGGNISAFKLDIEEAMRGYQEYNDLNLRGRTIKVSELENCIRIEFECQCIDWGCQGDWTKRFINISKPDYSKLYAIQLIKDGMDKDYLGW